MTGHMQDGHVRKSLAPMRGARDYLAMMDDEERYAALARRDATLDGVFFVAVRSTKIYCRPICPARIPLRKNTVFFRHAWEAQEAGFRPCLRCRPESAPDSPAWIGSLASINRALRLIDEGALVEGDIDALGARLGMTGRQLRRLFRQHIGSSPIAVEQNRRIHLAKKLLHETSLPVTEIAFAAGYGSVRRFNETFRALFGRTPSTLRRDPMAWSPGSAIIVTLAYRPPLDWSRCEIQTLPGSEAGIVDLGDFGDGAQAVLRPAAGNTVTATIEHVPLARIGAAIARLKRNILGGSLLSGAISSPRKPMDD